MSNTVWQGFCKSCIVAVWHVPKTTVTTASAQYLLIMYLWLPCMHRTGCA